ncbi:MAG: hypothetical protein CFE44_10050 [Burkholderiales bacterium PBB4]|nr:MAG: hypothetical protein CFE44_10050 [Burkholderiales bacterium PBB4]
MPTHPDSHKATPESACSAPPHAPFRVDVLVKQVYDASPPSTQSRMLNLLVGRAYADSPPQMRKSLLEHLIRSVGVLGLVTVAGGVFAKIRLRSSWPDIAVRLEDLQDIHTLDVVALVDYVQQVSTGALADAVQLLASNPSFTSSGAMAVLMGIILQRAPDRRILPRDGWHSE